MSTAKCPPAAILPIIFVPGIMGTRLSSPTDRNAWNPPSPFGLPEDATRASDENIPKEEWRAPPKPMTPMMTPPGIAEAYEDAWNADPANQPNEQYTREIMHRAAERDVPGWNSVADWSTSGGGARRRRLVGAPGEGFSDTFLSVNKGTPEERAGSGNLNRGVEWIIRATLA